MQNYSSLQETTTTDEESGVLVHVAEPSRARWNHIEDLDTFFVRMYQYHQRHGFYCMLLQEFLELSQYIFIVFLSFYVYYGIDYAVLFRYDDANITKKVTLPMVLQPLDKCISNFGFIAWLLLVIAFFVWIWKVYRCIYILFYFWDIKQFYNTALKVNDRDLDNVTWHEVQTRVRAVQIEQQMCIHKRELSDLDIYHRILRQQNYFVAMVNKRLLPPRINLPVVGEIVYWTGALHFNMQLLFFWSTWAPFEHPWHLHENYKKPNMRQELAQQMGKQILWLAFLNFLFAPLIFLYQILHAFFNHAAIIRKEPGVLAIRRWSLYGRLYLRHFNELDHELQARLTRAHKPASRYCQAFTSSIGSILAESLGFYATAVLAVILVLTFYDEDVLAVEHVLTIVTVLSIVVAGLRNLIPDETTSWDLQQLLTNVVVHTHYLPSAWRSNAHTSHVRKEFTQLFQYGCVGLLEAILSPIMIPYVLFYHIYPRRLDIVDFFRNFTVSVVGVGDVCSFAQMDIKKHGNPDWQDDTATAAPAQQSMHQEQSTATETAPTQYNQGEDGKVELSLMHFTYTNPSWIPPAESLDFVHNTQQHTSLLAPSYAANSFIDRNLDDSLWMNSINNQQQSNINPTTGSINPLHTSGMWRTEGPSIVGVRDITFSARYLHDRNYSRTGGRLDLPVEESTPLLWNH